MHTCWGSGAGTDSPVRIEVASGGEKCSTSVLETYGHDDLESNQWDTYDHEAVLGECAEFLLYSGNASVRVAYGGLGAYCADTINLQALPQITPDTALEILYDLHLFRVVRGVLSPL